MNKLKTLQLIHLAFCVSTLLFVTVTIFINFGTIHLNTPNIKNDPLLMIAPSFALMAIIGSRAIFNKMIEATRDNPAMFVNEKFAHYQTAFLVKTAILEGAILFNIVILFVTSNVFTLFFAGLCFIVLVLARPTKAQVASYLNLQDLNTLDGI